MDNQKKINETTIPNKKAFDSKLNLEDITDKDYAHAQKVFEELKLKSLGDYLNFYVQRDTHVFENFRNKCIEICKLDPAYFLSAPRFAWQACLRKAEVELELLIKIDILLMDKKGIRA